MHRRSECSYGHEPSDDMPFGLPTGSWSEHWHRPTLEAGGTVEHVGHGHHVRDHADHQATLEDQRLVGADRRRVHMVYFMVSTL